MSAYTEHVKRWTKCAQCHLCEHRKNVVFCRGKIPAQVLFVGEAPGDSEDVLGKPFMGPAGKALNGIIRQSFDDEDNINYCITNVVSCMPMPRGAPSKECVSACRPKLIEVVQMCNPKLIVGLGEVAKDSISTAEIFRKSTTIISVVHPAALFRMNVTQRNFAIYQSVNTIRSAVERSILTGL